MEREGKCSGTDLSRTNANLSEHHRDQIADYIEKVLRQKKKAENDLVRASDRIAGSR